MSDWLDEVTQLVFRSSFMTLATADADGLPWATPVEYACDETMRFYWNSHIDARHSRNVGANPRAAISIYDSTQIAGVDAPAEGLYAEGFVEVFHRADLAALLPSLDQWMEWRRTQRARPLPRATAEPEAADTPWRFYRLTATKVFALDPAGHPDFPGIRIWRTQGDLAESYTRAYRTRLNR